MSDRPLEYLDRYRPLQFAGCGSQGQKSIRLKRYISGDVMSGNEFRKKAYLDVRRFTFKTDRYEGGAHGATAHRYFDDTGYLVAPDLKPVVCHHCPWDDVRQGFQGKNTPGRMARVLKLLDYYLRHAEIDPPSLGWAKLVTDLQEYVDYYIGLDCNGFVGAWLEENRPGSTIVHNIDIDSYGLYYGQNASGSGFTRIDDPKAIRTGDVIIRRSVEGSTRHVALVEKVLSSSAKSAQLLLAESTGADGLCTNTVTFEKLSSVVSKTRHWKRGTKYYDAVIRSR
jgi:hypothetical protein